MSYKNTIKRHNHKVHTCLTERKEDLLKHLITSYQNKTIVVVSKTNTSTVEIEDKNITLTNDDGLKEMDSRKWDLLISFDLPTEADVYLKRLANIKSMALILVSPEEETLLYPIDMLLGKNLPRVVVPGYEVKQERKKNAPHRPTKSQQAQEDAYKDEIRQKQESIRERAAITGDIVDEEELKNVSSSQTKYLKDSKEDNKQKDKPSFGKKEWDKKPTRSVPGSRKPRSIKITGKKPSKES